MVSICINFYLLMNQRLDIMRSVPANHRKFLSIIVYQTLPFLLYFNKTGLFINH